MALTGDCFPRPAFLADLHRLLLQHPETTVLLLADGERHRVDDCLEQWARGLPAEEVIVARPGGGPEPAATERGVSWSRFQFINLPDWSGGGLSSDAVGILRAVDKKPDLVLSCSSYDPYGVLVKVELERSLLPLMKLWRSLYLIHDARFGVLRVADYKVIRDRVYRRPWRLRVYRAVVSVLFTCADLLAFGGSVGWQVGRR